MSANISAPALSQHQTTAARGLPLPWPAPPHLRLHETEADSEPQRAEVVLNDGVQLSGVLLAADFSAGVIEFRGDGAGERQLHVEDIQRLRLTRAVRFERVPIRADAAAIEAQPCSDTRTCSLVFSDGSTLQVLVCAAFQRSAGLFLFVAKRAGVGCQRWFIPSTALASFRLAEPIGKLLIDSAKVPPAAVDAGLHRQQHLKTIKLGQYLTEAGIVNREQLEAALLRQRASSHLRLGDALLKEGLINRAQRDTALAAQRHDRSKPLGEILVEARAVSREDVRRVLVEQLGIPAINLSRFACDPNAILALAPELARKHLMVPLYRSERRIAIAMERVPSWQILQEIEFSTRLGVDPALASREDLIAAIARHYGAAAPGEAIADIVAELGDEHDALVANTDATVTESDNTLVRLVNAMIVDAYDRGASDIHIESRPGKEASRVRFRIDGRLNHYIDVPANFRAALVSRLKVMSVMDIAERRRPQDGKIRFAEFGPRSLELRVVTIPTSNGLEDVVMRLLAAPRALAVDQLALPPRALAAVKAMVERSFGLLLVCGPTGSGKTTTLHSLLSYINTPDRKIWTVEDPIEISQKGLSQVQVNPKLDLSFPTVLRSILRADPDVIMVGEMRDTETARTVIAASLTGHLVLSTIHTNSAVESVVRLLDLGLDPFNFSDALLGVIGQRLVRRLCNTCCVAHAATAGEIDALAHEFCRGMALDLSEVVTRWHSRYGDADGVLHLNTPAGCDLCEHSGYKGRMGVYELLTATPSIKARIQARASSADILRDAIDSGMQTIVQDGIEKILQGHLDLLQVQTSCL